MTDPKQYLGDQIRQAQEHDRTGDVTLRNQIVSRLRNEEFGLPTQYVEQALKNAGLDRCTR